PMSPSPATMSSCSAIVEMTGWAVAESNSARPAHSAAERLNTAQRRLAAHRAVGEHAAPVAKAEHQLRGMRAQPPSRQRSSSGRQASARTCGFRSSSMRCVRIAAHPK
ncbi:hypothetical protein, partial [Streptomyces mirabilis]|uniref:hypothetical protein n=1 Tax=Streptomyces mirabilis TaxID=68239 RepID=UPI00332E55E6